MKLNQNGRLITLKRRNSGLFTAHIDELVLLHHEGTLNTFALLCSREDDLLADRYKMALNERGIKVEWEKIWDSGKSRGHHTYPPPPKFSGYQFTVKEVKQ